MHPLPRNHHFLKGGIVLHLYIHFRLNGKHNGIIADIADLNLILGIFYSQGKLTVNVGDRSAVYAIVFVNLIYADSDERLVYLIDHDTPDHIG